MRAILITSLACFLAVGCASKKPKADLIVENEFYPLSRDQVIMAIQECEQADTRPVLTKAPIRIAGTTTHIVIDVTCSPRYAR